MRLAVAFLAITLLAGCATPEDAPAAEPLANESVVFTEDYDLGNETIPQQDLQNATLGSEHEHDAWGENEQLVLLDDTAAAGLCEGPQDAAFYALASTFGTEGPAYGCVRLSLPEGVVVPEGTGELVIEMDAAEAMKAGAVQFQWRNKAHEKVEPATTEKQHTWTIPLEPADWDIPHAPATTFVMYLGASGPGAVFDGPVTFRILANKLPGWEPILAVAHVDHWKLPTLHDFAAPGVMRLLDAEASVTNIDPRRATSDAHPESLPLADIIAPGTKQLVIVADTTASDCAPVIQCWYVPQLHVGGYDRDRFGTLLFEEGGRRVYVWNVPDEVPYDSVYAEASTSAIEGRIDACATGGAGGPTCGFASMASSSATARLQVFAWESDVDVELLNALAGPAT